MPAYLLGAAVFLAGTLAAALIDIATPLATAIVLGGTFIGALIMVLPMLRDITKKQGKGQMIVTPKGLTLSFEVRSERLIRTVMPEVPTNSTQNQSARPRPGLPHDLGGCCGDYVPQRVGAQRRGAARQGLTTAPLLPESYAPSGVTPPLHHLPAPGEAVFGSAAACAASLS